MPRAGLTPDRVVAEAAAVADEVGLDRLTLAAVASRLGVTLPSLYKHVRGLDGLRRDLAVLAVRDLTASVGPAAVGRSGRDALHALATAWLDWALRRPALAAATVVAPAPDDAEHLAAAQEALGVLAAVLSAYHLEGDDLTDAVRSLRAALHGWAAIQAGGGFAMGRPVTATYERYVDALDAAFRTWGA